MRAHRTSPPSEDQHDPAAPLKTPRVAQLFDRSYCSARQLVRYRATGDAKPAGVRRNAAARSGAARSRRALPIALRRAGFAWLPVGRVSHRPGVGSQSPPTGTRRAAGRECSGQTLSPDALRRRLRPAACARADAACFVAGNGAARTLSRQAETSDDAIEFARFGGDLGDDRIERLGLRGQRDG